MPEMLARFVRATFLMAGLLLCWLAVIWSYDAYVGPVGPGVMAGRNDPTIVGTRPATEREHKTERYIGAAFMLIAGGALCYGAIWSRLKPGRV